MTARGAIRLLLASAVALSTVLATPASAAPRLERAALQRAATALARNPAGARAVAPILELAALRGDIGPGAMLAAIGPALKRWSTRLEKLEAGAVTLRLLVADLARRAGSRAHLRYVALPGEVTQWAWLGPMPADAGTAFDRTTGLESATARTGRAAGRDGPVRWRPVPADLWPSPRLGELIERPSEAVMYAETWLGLRGDAAATLSVVTAGRVRVYLDGKLVAARGKGSAGDTVAKPLPRPLFTRVHLAAGWHCLRLKLMDSDGRVPVTVAVQADKGGPIGFTSQPGPGLKMAASRKLERVDAMAAMVAKAGVKPEKSALQAIAWARLHGWPMVTEAAQLLAEAAATDGLAALAHAAGHDAPGDRLAILSAAVKRPMPPHVRVAVLLAGTRALVDLERPAAAHRAWLAAGRALRWRPSTRSAAACNTRVDLWLQLGADLAALTEAGACATRWPRSLHALQGLGRLLRSRDDLAGATALQKRIVALAPADPREVLDLVALASSTGTMAPAIAAYGHRTHRDPAMRRVRETLATAHLAAGRGHEARKALSRLPRWQWRAATFALSSRIAVNRADKARAVRDLQTALRRAPGRDDYRARMRLLMPGDRFYKPYQHNLLALARKLPPPTEPVSTPLTQIVIRHDGARQARYEAELLSVGKGGTTSHSVAIDYVPSQSSVEVLEAAVVKRDGRVVRRVERELEQLSEGADGLYYDLESLTLTFKDLEAGDVVVLEHVVRDFVADPFGMVFGEQLLLGHEHPVGRSTVTIELPAGSPLQHKAWDPRKRRPLPSGLARAGTRVDKGLTFDVWRLSAGPLAAVASEASMPGATEVVPYLHVSSFASWAAVARWYGGLVEQALAGAAKDPRIRTLAKRLAASADSEPERIRAVFRYVADHIRYVGLEFGIHSLKPHDASQVLARRFGDCKDKATLIVALLRQMGIEGRVALVRTGGNGAVTDGIASLSVFDHAIAWIPGHRWWLDATQQHHAIGELPSLDVGGMALRIPAGAEKPAEKPDPLPHASAAANRRVGESRYRLKADGTATGGTSIGHYGLPAADYRKRMHAESVRVERIEADIHKRWPGAEVDADTVVVAGMTPPSKPAVLSYNATIPGYARRAGGELMVRPFAPAAPLRDRLAGKAGRKNDLELARAFTEIIKVRLTPPPGWAALPLPDAVDIDDKHARLKLTFTMDGRDVVAALELVARSQRIPAGDHDGWRETLAGIDRGLRAAVRFAPVGPAAAGSKP